MKYIKISLLLLFSAGIFASCTDWFDVKPKTEIRAEDLFKSKEGFWEALTGVYLNMAAEDAYGRYLTWEAIEFMAWQHEAGTNSDWNDLQAYIYNTTGPLKFIDKTWERLYNIIAEANYLLWALEEYGDVLIPQEYDVIKGQALAIRAYCHFDLMRLFAEGNLAADPSLLSKPCIPFVETYDKAITPQKDYAWTLDRVMKDVTEAIHLLDQEEYAETVRVKKIYSNMNDEAIKLLAARIELWRGNHTAALGYANEIITMINNEEASVDRDDPKYRWARDTNQGGIFVDELLFYISVYKLHTWTTNPDAWGPSTSNELISVTPTSVEENIFMMIPEVPNFSVSNSELRYTSWYARPAGENNKEEGEDETAGRESVKVKVTEDTDKNYIGLLRISEAWLIAAECELEVGTRDRAIELVNHLRYKRRNSETFMVRPDVPESDLRRIIMLEQLREVSQEGQAFFLYKRLNEEYMVGQTRKMTASMYLIPYPQSEVRVGHRNDSN